MKKVLISGFLGIAFAFAMVACNGSAKNNDSVVDNEQPACEQAEEHQCMHHCDSLCNGDSTCHKDCAAAEQGCCKKQGEGCKGHEGEGCCKKQGEGCKGHEGEGCCKKQGEGCKKECEHHNK